MRLLCIGAVLAMAISGCASSRPPQGSAALRTVAFVEPERYVGLWHQIALIPNRFQSTCARDTRATYAILDATRLSVVNRCLRADGREESVEGVARIVDPATNARLRVSFLPAWLRWTGIGEGNYWVIDLDPDYSIAVVGEPSREFLWVLSRKPEIDEEKRNALRTRIRAAGYDPARVEWEDVKASSPDAGGSR